MLPWTCLFTVSQFLPPHPTTLHQQYQTSRTSSPSIGTQRDAPNVPHLPRILHHGFSRNHNTASFSPEKDSSLTTSSPATSQSQHQSPRTQPTLRSSSLLAHCVPPGSPKYPRIIESTRPPIFRIFKTSFTKSKPQHMTPPRIHPNQVFFVLLACFIWSPTCTPLSFTVSSTKITLLPFVH